MATRIREAQGVDKATKDRKDHSQDTKKNRLDESVATNAIKTASTIGTSIERR